MSPTQLKKGRQVKIRFNIQRTVQILSANDIMRSMADSDNTYTIDSTQFFGDHKVAMIDGYLWMPEDLMDIEVGITDPVNMKGKKVLFDPSEL